ncbi:hypothetical protein G6F65_021978 [Rhizopus arrhizus]|nr:hypothetical protein G6F65_021978 [Rhizopus arrhizus]
MPVDMEFSMARRKPVSAISAASAEERKRGQHHPDQALLTHFLVDRHKHDAIVMDALQPEEHPHHTDVQDQHHGRRDPIHAAAAGAGVIVERLRVGMELPGINPGFWRKA